MMDCLWISVPALGLVAVTAAGCGDSSSGGGDAGAPEGDSSILVNVSQNACPAIDVFVASPASVPVGGAIGLTASASDGNSDSLEYLWTASAGTFGSKSVASTTYVCAAEGRQTITLTVSDRQCSREASVEVTCVRS